MQQPEEKDKVVSFYDQFAEKQEKTGINSRHLSILDKVKQAGLKPVKSFIRGGTDGSRLSFMGLPCPNLFAGEHAFHSLEEWVSVQDMEKSSEMIVHLAGIWSNHEK